MLTGPKIGLGEVDGGCGINCKFVVARPAISAMAEAMAADGAQGALEVPMGRSLCSAVEDQRWWDKIGGSF